MQETALHADLKKYILSAGGKSEVPVDGFLIDVVQDDLLVEIQTRNFSALKEKLPALLSSHPIRIVHPISQELWIVLREVDGRIVHRRKSTRKGRLEDLFYELVYVARWIAHPNFTLQVLLIAEEQERVRDGTGSWRRKGVRIHSRRLVDIHSSYTFRSLEDYKSFLPFPPRRIFSNAELAHQLKIPTRLAAKITFSLVEAGLLGKSREGRSNKYWLIDPQEALDG
jgi:hypothetical protein